MNPAGARRAGRRGGHPGAASGAVPSTRPTPRTPPALTVPPTVAPSSHYEAPVTAVPPTAARLGLALRLFCETGERTGVSPPWSMTVALVDAAVEERITMPSEARLHLLAAGRHAGVGWDAVRQMERVAFEATPAATAGRAAGAVAHCTAWRRAGGR